MLQQTSLGDHWWFVTASFLPRFMPLVEPVSSLLPYEFASMVVSWALVPRKLA